MPTVTPGPLPLHCPGPADLDVLDLWRSGVLDPRAADLRVGPDVVAAARSAGGLELTDDEGVPLARVDPAHLDQTGRVLDEPKWLGRPSARPHERLYRTAEDVRGSLTGDELAVVVDHPLSADEQRDLLTRADGRDLIVLALTGPSHSPYGPAPQIIASLTGLADDGRPTTVVAVPCSREQLADPPFAQAVLQAYLGDTERIVLDQPPAQQARSGLVLFFTGLSGSGKSTVARAVRDAIMEQDARPVSLLDGDLVRRHLSAGLGFSPADRETNIRRIGWIAAEVAYHGGIAVCSPIAPYAATRADVREMTRERGGDFVLVHISTPVEVCEERDRKGLYAKARAGEIPDFTGISAPYEEPDDADLHLDTSQLSIEAARDQVLALLAARGHHRAARPTTEDQQ